MVEDIKKLSPELEIYVFTDWGQFDHSEIGVPECGAPGGVSAEIPKRSWCLKSEAVGIEPRIDGADVHFTSRNDIGPRRQGDAIARSTRLIVTISYVRWIAGASGFDSADLPALDESIPVEG